MQGSAEVNHDLQKCERVAGAVRKPPKPPIASGYVPTPEGSRGRNIMLQTFHSLPQANTSSGSGSVAAMILLLLGLAGIGLSIWLGVDMVE